MRLLSCLVSSLYLRIVRTSEAHSWYCSSLLNCVLFSIGAFFFRAEAGFCVTFMRTILPFLVAICFELLSAVVAFKLVKRFFMNRFWMRLII